MTTSDRRGRREDEDALRRPPKGTPPDSGGLLERYGDRHTPSTARRDDGHHSSRRDGHSSSRAPRAADPPYPPRTHGARDNGAPRRRPADRYSGRSEADYGRSAEAHQGVAQGRVRAEVAPEWERPGRKASPPRKNIHRVVLLASLAVLVLGLPPLLVFGVWPKLQELSGTQVNTLFPWASSTQQTALNPDNSGFATQHDAVDPAFQAYYTAHAGSTTLGTPLTPALVTSAGIVQFYAFGALLAPGAPSTATPAASATETPTSATRGSSPGDSVLRLVGTGPSASGGATPTAGTATIVALPVVAGLLKAGSQTPVTDGASMTFVDLRRAAMPDQLVSGTTTSPLPTATPSQPVFIATDTQHKQGHAIPAALWTYITRPDVAPAGWQSDIGVPLTEAQTLTVTQSGATHHLLVQAFWYAVLVADADSLTSAHPAIARASIGLQCLLTLGPPSISRAANAPAWALGTAAVLDAPVSGNETVHIGQNFPLALTGESQWSKATLWYGVSWSSLKRSGKGWLSGAALTFAAPDKSQPAQASFDVLSPDLAAYLAGQGDKMGAAVYDLSRNAYYAYNDTGSFDLASSSKIVIMVSYLDWVEKQNRALRSDEINTMTLMIESSDNNAAQLLFIRVGYGAGQRAYLQKLGLADNVPCDSGFGCANLSPASVTRVLTLLYQGKILTSEHRQLALNLMSHINCDLDPGNACMGVGTTAPQGATVYMKNGWRAVDDTNYTDWTLNTSGIVVVGNETYVISVFSNHSAHDDWTAVNKVCGDTAKLLTS